MATEFNPPNEVNFYTLKEKFENDFKATNYFSFDEAIYHIKNYALQAYIAGYNRAIEDITKEQDKV